LLERFIAARHAFFAARHRGSGLARAHQETAEFLSVAKQTVVTVCVIPAFADHTSAGELETKLTTRTFQFRIAAREIVTNIHRATVAVATIGVNHTFDVSACIHHFLTDLIFRAR